MDRRSLPRLQQFGQRENAGIPAERERCEICERRCGKLPFLEHLEYLDRQITIVGTGGLLTMLAEPGSGTLAGGAHTEAFRQIARGDAAVLSEAFQRDFDTPLLAQAFGDRPPLAYFQFSPPTEGNPSKVVDDAVKLAGAGYPVRTEEVSEKTGYQIET